MTSFTIETMRKREEDVEGIIELRVENFGVQLGKYIGWLFP